LRRVVRHHGGPQASARPESRRWCQQGRWCRQATIRDRFRVSLLPRRELSQSSINNELMRAVYWLLATGYCTSAGPPTGATGHSAQGAILRSRRESVGKGQHSAFLRSAYWVFAPLRRVHGSSRWPLSQLVLPLPLCLQDEGRGKVSPRAREAARAHMWSGSAGRRVRAPARHWNRRHL
jgi:hypothetical protein